jgi:magnesium chelatase family protein
MTVGPVELPELGKKVARGTETQRTRGLVLAARAAQAKRFGKEGRLNSELSPRELEDLVPLSQSVRTTLERAGQRLNLSPRAFHRVIKVARTIADLDGAEHINESHVLEALQYRERKH